MKYFQSIGAEVYAIANNEDQEQKKSLESMGIICLEVPFERNPIKLDNIRAYNELRKIKKSIHFDLIHTHTPVVSFLVRLAYRRNKNTKVIYTSHGFHFYKGAAKLNWLIFFSIEKLAVKWTDHIITINKEDFNNAKKLGFKEQSISYLHGVGVDRVNVPVPNFRKQQLINEFSIKENEIIITCVAELNHNKNQMFLLENWKLIKEQCSEAKLLIVGTGSEAENYKRYVDSRSLEDIVFLGFRDDVMDILHISHIITLLSKREGLGKCILEGMIVGLPCVVTNTRGPRDLVIDGINGYIVNLDDRQKLVERFVNLIKNEHLRSELGFESSKKVREYLLENVIEEYKDLYQKILSSV